MCEEVQMNVITPPHPTPPQWAKKQLKYAAVYQACANYIFKNRCSHMYSSRVDFPHMFTAIQNLAEISTQHRSNEMLNSSWSFNCLSRIQHIPPLSSKHRQLLWKAAVGALRPLWRCAGVPAPNPQGLHLHEAKRNDVSQRIDRNRIQMSSNW